jgi:uncharacterized protein (DUF433 family)
MDDLSLITVDPQIAHGQACIRGTRIPVSVILDCPAAGMPDDDILANYPTLTVAAIRAAASYAARPAREEILPLAPLAAHRR